MKKLLLILFILKAGTSLSQRLHPDHTISLSPALSEISGITNYKTNFIAVNDSGNEPCLFIMDKNGEIKKILKHNALQNIDWEAAAKDNKGNYYIADIGNNDNLRKNLCIYKISTDPVLEVKRIDIRYADQNLFPPVKENLNYDAEALVWNNDSLSLFTKNNTSPYNGYTRVYRIPTEEGSYSLLPVDSISLGTGGLYFNSVTDASFNSQNNQLALLTYNHLYLFNDFNGRNLSHAYYSEFVFDSYSQKEALLFDENNNVIITDEKSAKILGGKMYWYNIRNYLEGSIPYTTNTIEKVFLRHKGKGRALLHYFVTEHGEYELVFFDNKENIMQHHYLPIGNKLKESKEFIFDIDYKSASRWILRLYRNKKMVYCNKFTKMFYD